MEPVRLRPLSVGEILDAAIKVYRSRFGTLVKAVALVVAPVQILSAVIQVSVPNDAISTTNEFGETSVDAAALIGTMVALLATFVLGWIAGQLATGASLKVVSDAYLNEETDWRTSLRFIRARIGRLLLFGALLFVCSVLALLACVIPLIYLYATWAVAVPALLLEDKSPASALSRSMALVKGNWWRVAGCLVVAAILSGVVGGVFQAVLLAVVSSVDSEVVRVTASAIAGVASSVLVTPFSAAVTAILYFDLRVRKEGFDLELLARSVSVEPSAELLAAPGFDTDTSATTDDQPPFWPPPPGWQPRGG